MTRERPTSIWRFAGSRFDLPTARDLPSEQATRRPKVLVPSTCSQFAFFCDTFVTIMTGYGGAALRMLIVDSEPLVRLGLSEALSDDSSFAVIGETAWPLRSETLVADDEIELVLVSGQHLQPEVLAAVTDAAAAGRRVAISVHGGQATDISLISAPLVAALAPRRSRGSNDASDPRPRSAHGGGCA
jgi:hypothetical protein